MAIHPPMLYIGFVGFAIPFCFAMAALFSGRLNDSWIRATRRWVLVPWMFLGLDLLLGGRWAYDVLGWGGYWGWDPVENAALMPWLAGHRIPAFRDGAGTQRDAQGVEYGSDYYHLYPDPVWHVPHAQWRGAVRPRVCPIRNRSPLFGFYRVHGARCRHALFFRVDKLQSENEFDSLFSREVLFLLNNVLFLGAAIAILIGVMWPILSEVITGETLTVGAPYYNLVVGSILASLFC